MSALPLGSIKTTRNLKNGSVGDEMSLKFKRRHAWNAQLCNTKRVLNASGIHESSSSVCWIQVLTNCYLLRCSTGVGVSTGRWRGIGGAGRPGVPRTNQQVLTRCINGSRQIRCLVYRHLAETLKQTTTENSRTNFMREW